MDGVVESEEDEDATQPQEGFRRRRQEPRGGPERQPEEAVAEGSEGRPERSLEAGHGLRRRLSGRDALLEVDRPTEDGRRQVGMAVEELQVPRHRLRALGGLRI